jgi:predicted O-methyltransferase YrrM
MSPTFDSWISNVLGHEAMTQMGHGQRRETANLGLGWLYYGMARVIQPSSVVVIGSYRGFVPLMMGRALADHGSGTVKFIDPSLVDNFWREPAAVNEHFANFGLTNIEHHCVTTQQFVLQPEYRSLGDVGILFIDGYHSHEQARFDFEAFEHLVTSRGVIFFHDSIVARISRIYGPGKAYQHRVCDFMTELRKDARYQVFDIPYGDGLTMVRKQSASEILFP